MQALTLRITGRRFLTIRHYAFAYRHDAAEGEVWVLDVFGPGWIGGANFSECMLLEISFLQAKLEVEDLGDFFRCKD